MIKYIILTLFLFFSCGEKERQYQIDKSLDFPSFHSQVVKNYLKEFALAKANNYIHLNECVIDSSYEFFDAYKCNDTMFLFFSPINAHVDFLLTKKGYKVSLRYITDIEGTYPDNKKAGIFIEPELKYSKMILNDNSFNIGDTLRGYFEIETKPFFYNKNKDIDRYFVQFITIIRPYDMEKLIYPMHSR